MEKVEIRKTNVVENILTHQKFRGTKVDRFVSNLEKSVMEIDPERKKEWAILTEGEYQELEEKLKEKRESYLCLAEGNGGSMKWFFAVGREVVVL